MKRRGNGLVADSYAPLTDLPTHLADRVLDALREAGVAAYVTPAADPAAPHPAGTSGEWPDRLYVDTAMRSAAEGVVHVQLTGLPDTAPPLATEGDLLERTGEPGAGGEQADTAEQELDEDAIWAQIVAGYDAEPQGEAPWPDQEDVPEARRPREPADDGPADPPDDEIADRGGLLPTARVIKPADEPPPPDEEGHYVPPPPPPLPSTDKVTKAAWLALVGGPLYLLVTVLLGWQVPGWAAFLAVAAFIGGFVALVLRMGDDPRDPDDGAVV